jgi:hypothetical protein
MSGQPLCSMCQNSDPQLFVSSMDMDLGPGERRTYFRVVCCAQCGYVVHKKPIDPSADEFILLRESKPRRL